MQMDCYLKAKVQEIRVTSCERDYEGSITLDPNIMDAIGVSEGEQVFINGKHRKSRIMTYVLSGERGANQCEINGGAVEHFNEGDIIHLLFFTWSDRPVGVRKITCT